MPKYPFRSEMMQSVLNSRHRIVRVLGWIVAPISLLGKMFAPSVLLLPLLILHQNRAGNSWLVAASLICGVTVIGLGILAVRRTMNVMRTQQVYSLDDICLFQGCLLCLPAIALFLLVAK